MTELFPPPRRAIPRRVFDALVEEAKLRRTRSCDDWIRKERLRVLDIVNEEREGAGKNLVTENDVLRVERMACGHIDYLWKFAYGAEELVHKP